MTLPTTSTLGGDAHFMEPLRVVLVMIEPPLPFGNAAGRGYYVLLKGLVERGHRVTAFAACSKPDELAKARALFPAPAFDLRLYPFPVRQGWRAKWETARRPFSYMFGSDIREDLGRVLAAGTDILHVEQLWGGWLALGQAARTLISVHYLAAIDLGGPRTGGLRDGMERSRIIRNERRMIRRFRYFRTLTPRLDEPIRQIHPAAVVRAVPSGLDGALYDYIADDRRAASPTITLIGSMGWAPSHSAAVRLLSRLWPAIKQRVPAAKLQIVGWSAREKLAGYLGLPDVAIDENVPEILPYFERASVLVYAPGRGSGMKVKIQEAMAFGVPIVTTSEGVEGLPAEDGVHAGIAEDDDGLIERTITLLNDPGLQNRQRLAARALLERHCGPAAVLDGIEAVYAAMIRDRVAEESRGRV